MNSKLSTMPMSVEIMRCLQCRRSLPAGSSYCLYCGAPQQEQPQSQTLAAEPETSSLTTRWGAGSLIALLLGVACLIAAVVTGALFSQQNYYDWQAVQAWRLQWLGAGIACFLLSLCLRGLRNRSER